MQYGVVMFPTDYAIRPDELARAVEARGFESLWVPEHTHIPASRKSPWPGGGHLPKEYWHTLDPFVALAMAAAVTTNAASSGTGICLVIERDPITLAKEVASLDHLSGGRFLFGIGGGWNAEEMEDHGTAFKTRWRRAARADPGHEGALDEGRGRVPRRVRELRHELVVSQAGAEAAPADPHGRRRRPRRSTACSSTATAGCRSPAAWAPASPTRSPRSQRRGEGRRRKPVPVTAFMVKPDPAAIDAAGRRRHRARDLRSALGRTREGAATAGCLRKARKVVREVRSGSRFDGSDSAASSEGKGEPC